MNIGIIQCIIPKILHIYSSLIILCASDAAPGRIYRQQKTAPAARFFRGDNRTRTCDPLHVKQMLSQLSYVSAGYYSTIWKPMQGEKLNVGIFL